MRSRRDLDGGAPRRWRALLGSGLALLVACGSGATRGGAGGSSEDPSQEPLSPVAAPEPAAPTPDPVRAHAQVLGEPSWSGLVSEGRTFAHVLARMVEPCFDGHALPRELGVRVPVDPDGSLGEAQLEPAEAGDAELLACVRAALAPAHLEAMGDPLGGSLLVPLRVEAASAARVPFEFPAHPGDLCSRDQDCVLIQGVCGGPVAVRERRATERSRENTLRAASAGCTGVPTPRPLRAVCEGFVCATAPSDHPEWRSCTRSSECVNVPRGCGGWDVVARRAEAEARAAFAAEVPDCSRESDPDDTHQSECRYGFCAFEWRGT